MAPHIEVDAASIRMIMVSECAPASSKDYFYAKGEPLFAQTTLQAFRDAGEQVSSVSDLLRIGVYLTTAIKCAKVGYAVSKEALLNCSALLEREIASFPNTRVLLLMGDAAIYAANCISKKLGLKRAIPAGSTYKIREGSYELKGMRLLPSYLQAGPSFFIEKSKRKMIAEDIAKGLRLIRSR